MCLLTREQAAVVAKRQAEWQARLSPDEKLLLRAFEALAPVPGREADELRDAIRARLEATQ